MKPLWLIVVAALISTLATEPARGGAADKRLDIYWIDVEGGAATLVVTPRGQSILIDTPVSSIDTLIRRAGESNK